MWTSRHVDHIHELRLETSWKMLQTAHFNAKMNALKEISKLVEESQSQTRHVKSPIPHQRLLQWMKENEVLETALEGNCVPLWLERVVEELFLALYLCMCLHSSVTESACLT